VASVEHGSPLRPRYTSVHLPCPNLWNSIQSPSPQINYRSYKSHEILYTLQKKRLAESLRKPPPWAGGFFFGNLELSMELWAVIVGLSGFDDS